MGKRQQPNNGEQLVNKVDLNKITIDFIKFYYGKWMESCDDIIASNMFKPNTKINIDGKTFNLPEFYSFLKTFEKSNYRMESYQFVPDGGRRVDIMTKGILTKDSIKKTMIQNIALIECRGGFYIRSTQIYFI